MSRHHTCALVPTTTGGTNFSFRLIADRCWTSLPVITHQLSFCTAAPATPLPLLCSDIPMLCSLVLNPVIVYNWFITTLLLKLTINSSSYLLYRIIVYYCLPHAFITTIFKWCILKFILTITFYFYKKDYLTINGHHLSSSHLNVTKLGFNHPNKISLKKAEV